MLARKGRPFLDQPFSERREELRAFGKAFGASSFLSIGKAATTSSTAKRWIGQAGLDGLRAKRLDLNYRPGERVMQKFKVWEIVDCVVGGLYWRGNSRTVDSLLLGLYGDEGELNYVGRARVHAGAAEMGELLEPLIGGEGFTGRAPGGKSRWSGKEREAVPLRPVLVAEVSADHITGEHMRHGARLLRWRTDKPPGSCTMDQIK